MDQQVVHEEEEEEEDRAGVVCVASAAIALSLISQKPDPHSNRLFFSKHIRYTLQYTALAIHAIQSSPDVQCSTW